VVNSAPAALTVWQRPPGVGNRAVGKTAYRVRMAAVCASAMVRLLNDGAAGRAGFLADGALRPLRPADFAVLVNNRDEAEKIRAALAARGVRSVYLSETESVFRSPQVAEVQHWLAACAEPDDPRLIRAALATPTLGLGWQQLDRLNRDELAWETCAQRFRGYGDCWRRQGVLPMLRRLLHDFDVPARLLGGAAGGERILTDLLHLAELLQQASALLDGEHALIRHLAEQCREAERATGAGDARQIRLESDADLVQVVTVHKSKGLEYPLVFLPFACGFREVGKDELPLKYHDDDGRLQLVLRADEALLARADRERLGEDLRKFYVALTRARHATWVGTAPLDKLERSAFGYLLGGGETIAPEQLQSALDALRGDCADIAIATAPPAGDECLRTTVDRTALGPARESLRQVREHWWIASYSSLRTLDEEQRAAPDTATEELLQEALHPSPPTMPGAVPAAAHSLHAFPRGAEVGTFLHALLEWVAEQGFAAVANDAERLRETIARRCALRGWSAWIEPLSGWFRQLLTTPLPLPGAGSVALAELKSAIAEMEFWLAAHHVDIAAIERLVRTHTLDGAARPALRPGQLNGMLKGFIDLVFEHDGRFYVADYKSNWLGSDDDAYTPAAMRAAVLHARYELQYVLYLLALHRLLKSRLPDYDYDRHIGGAVYLFLRGSGAPGRGVHAERPPRQLIESLDRLFTGSGRRASA
jgi:exodeoxyribonuclease V beta subunit